MILIRSIQEELYKIITVCFNTLVLHLMLLMMERKMTVMMVKGKNKLLLTHKTYRSLMKWRTPNHLQESHLNLNLIFQQQGNNTTTLNPLQESNTRQKDVLGS